MIAEKYRPRTFADIVGHASVIRSMTWHLERAEGSGHAFLLTGPSGSGKTSLAHCAAEYLGITEYDRHVIQSAECDVETLREVAGLIERKKIPRKPSQDIAETKGVVEAIMYLRKTKEPFSLELDSVNKILPFDPHVLCLQPLLGLESK